jgi:hypothetical protein
MPFGRQKEIQRTIAQSSSSSNTTSCLSSNNNKTDDNGHLQSPDMSTKNNKENFSLLNRLKVRFNIYFLLNKSRNMLSIKKKIDLFYLYLASTQFSKKFIS